MFYTMLGIVVVKSFLLLFYSSVPEKDKFTKQCLFREALYKALFACLKDIDTVGTADTLLFMAGPVDPAALGASLLVH